MKLRSTVSCIAAGIAATVLSAACASQPVTPVTPANAPVVAATPPITPVKDQRAIIELKRMSDTLTSAKSLSFMASSMKPLRGPNGQWVHVFTTAKVDLQRPNKLFIATGGDAFPQSIYFNGQTFAVSAPQEKLFTQREMTGNVDTMLAQAADKGGEAFAFSDVLLSDPFTSWTTDLEGAVYVGQSTRGNEKLQHIALSAKNVDWEIWIDSHDHLPRMVYVKYIGAERSPSTLIEFTHWKVNPKLAASTFVFHAPRGAKQAKMKAPEQAQAQGAQQ
jgi:hypothetical protein